MTNNNRVIVLVLCFFPCFCSPRDKSSALWRSHRGTHQPQQAEDALCSAPLAAREPGYRRSPRCSSCRKLNPHRGNFLPESDLGNQRKTLHPDSFTAFQRQTLCQPWVLSPLNVKAVPASWCSWASLGASLLCSGLALHSLVHLLVLKLPGSA